MLFLCTAWSGNQKIVNVAGISAVKYADHVSYGGAGTDVLIAISVDISSDT